MPLLRVERTAFGGTQDKSMLSTWSINQRWRIFATLRKLTADNAEQQVSLTQMEPPMKARLSLLKESIELHQGTPDYPKQQDALTGQSASCPRNS